MEDIGETEALAPQECLSRLTPRFRSNNVSSKNSFLFSDPVSWQSIGDWIFFESFFENHSVPRCYFPIDPVGHPDKFILVRVKQLLSSWLWFMKTTIIPGKYLLRVVKFGLSKHLFAGQFQVSTTNRKKDNLFSAFRPGVFGGNITQDSED